MKEMVFMFVDVVVVVVVEISDSKFK